MYPPIKQPGEGTPSILGDMDVPPFWPPFLTFWEFNKIFLGYFFLSKDTKTIFWGTKTINPYRIRSFWPQIPFFPRSLWVQFSAAHHHRFSDRVPPPRHRHIGTGGFILICSDVLNGRRVGYPVAVIHVALAAMTTRMTSYISIAYQQHVVLRAWHPKYMIIWYQTIMNNNNILKYELKFRHFFLCVCVCVVITTFAKDPSCPCLVTTCQLSVWTQSSNHCIHHRPYA